MKLNNKEYNYKLNLDHIFLFSAILGSLEIDTKSIPKSSDGLVVAIGMIKGALKNLKTVKQELIEFISSIYTIDKNEVNEMDPVDFIELWFNFLEDKKIKNFLLKRLGFGKLKK